MSKIILNLPYDPDPDDTYSYFLAYRHLPDSRFVGIIPSSFGTVRIVTGVPPPTGYDGVW